MQSKLTKNRGGFTLVEIMIVVAIIALLAAIAVPNFMRARKRTQATQILDDLRIIDAAIDQYFIENDKNSQSNMSWEDVKKYIKAGSRLYNTPDKDVLSNVRFYDYTTQIGDGPRVGLSAASFNELSDVAPAEFWSPFPLEGAN